MGRNVISTIVCATAVGGMPGCTAFAASFEVDDGQTITTTQTLTGPQDMGAVAVGGSISLTSASQNGIESSGPDNTIVNGGTIETGGNDATTIHASGAGLAITNSGTIRASGDNSYVIDSSGAGSTLDSSGSILNIGYRGIGVRFDGPGATIVNSGTIGTSSVSPLAGNVLILDGADASLDNSGAMSTSGDNTIVVYSSGDGLRLSNSGLITTSAYKDIAIESEGDGAVIVNTVIISTLSITGSGSDAIRSTGSGAFITNASMIVATGLDASAIRSTGEDAAIASTGSLTASGDNGFGIYSGGDGASIVNAGSIAATGYMGTGIFSSGAYASIANSGPIEMSSASGFAGNGIRSTGTGAEIVNSSDIATTGISAAAIRSEGAFASIATSGHLFSYGDNGYGIYSQGDDTGIVNSGEIQATGWEGIGIYSIGRNAAISNLGRIATSAENAVGIDSAGYGASILNYGVIETSGTARDAIRSTGDAALIVNNGVIGTSGDNAFGIYSQGDGATVINNGSISATGVDSNAIEMLGSNAALELRPGSAVVGGIYFADPTSATLKLGRGLNASFSFIDLPATIEAAGQPYVVKGNSVTVMDMTSFAASDAYGFDLAKSVTDTVEARMSPRGSDALMTGSLPGERRVNNAVWLSGFGFLSDRRASGTLDGYDYRAGAIAFGLERELGGFNVAGVFGGASAGRIATASASTRIDATGAFAGAYWGWDEGSAFSRVVVAAGAMENDWAREIADNTDMLGQSTAHARYGSFFINPSLALGLHHRYGETIISPSLRLAYAGLLTRSYSESGADASMAVGSRLSNLVSVRAQIEADFGGCDTNLGVLGLSARAGAEESFGWGSSVDAQLLGSDLSFQSGAGGSLVTGFLGAGSELSMTNGIVIAADAQASYDSARALSLTARAGVRGTF